MTSVGPYRRLSLWWDEVGDPLADRPALDRDLDVDVAIVGAGFTGLWTAHSLLVADSSLRVAVLEREVAGFGASGRNGGWCSALFPASDARIARDHGEAAARAMREAMQATVDEVGRVTADEGIDCHFTKGGTVVVARSRAQVHTGPGRDRRGQGARRGRRGPALARRRRSPAPARCDRVLGATYTPHCAALQPARLARGLAAAVERRGGTIYERTGVTAIEEGGPPGTGGGSARRPTVRATGGTVTADVVVRAIEGWTPQLPGHERALVPVYSLMVATEPLGDAFWDDAGLTDRATFSDHRHLIVYGQRTTDGRIAFGGRGAPYHFGSAVRLAFDQDPAVHRALRQALVDLFPALADVSITHTWGGPLGVPRDWFASVGLGRSTGLAWAGGYVGDGVSTANLAGRTLADLILGRDSDLVRLPWVGHRSPQWEREPLRWLGVNAGRRAVEAADRTETRRGRPSRLATAVGRFLGS